MNKKIIITVIGLVLIVLGIWLITSYFQPGEPEDESPVVDQEIIDTLNRAQEIEALYYDVVVDAPEIHSSGSVWHKGDKFRMEVAEDDEKQVFIIDFDEEMAYIFQPGVDQLTQGHVSAATGLTDYVFKDQAILILDYYPVIAARETIEGRDYLVLEYKQYGDNITKAWIWSEYGLPVRMVTEGSGGLVEIRAENIDLNPVISDELFIVPEFGEINYLPDPF